MTTCSRLKAKTATLSNQATRQHGAML